MRTSFVAFSVLFLLIAALVVAPQPLFGQAFTANLTGVVSDPSGGAVPNATVRVKSVATS